MKIFIISVMALIFLMPAVYADWSGASGDRNISYYVGPEPSFIMARYPRLAVGPEGNLYCVWRQGQTLQSYELFFGKSTDNGVTWNSETQDIMISADDGQDVSSIGDKPYGLATDSHGNIFVVWAEELTTTREIMLLKSTDQGDTWIHSDTDYNISFDGAPYNNAGDPDIAIDCNDNIFVVWHQDADVDTTEVFISISTDGGETWSGQTSDRYISFRSGNDGNNADIAIAPNKDIYVVWDEKADPSDITSYQIQYGKSTDGGATFNSETADLPISTWIRSSGDAYLVIGPAGDIHVTWQATMSSASPFRYAIFYSGSSDEGVTWSGLSGPQYVDFGPDDDLSAWNQGMGVTSEGNLIAVWNENHPIDGNAEIYASYSFDGGATWSGNNEPELLSFPDVYGAYNPDVIAGLGDTLHVVWNEGVASTGYYDIHYSKGDTLASGFEFPVGIAGTVTLDDSPLENVLVEAVGVNASDLTDVDGTYSIACLAAGTYDVFFSHIDIDDTTITDVLVNPNGEFTIVDLAIGGGGPQCDYVVGDINDSGGLNGLDVTYGVAYFKGGAPPPYQCECTPGSIWYVAGDVNNSCAFNGLDITYLVSYFKGGASPIPCADCPPIG
jgi:hypothetical protein